MRTVRGNASGRASLLFLFSGESLGRSLHDPWQILAADNRSSQTQSRLKSALEYILRLDDCKGHDNWLSCCAASDNGEVVGLNPDLDLKPDFLTDVLVSEVAATMHITTRLEHRHNIPLGRFAQIAQSSEPARVSLLIR